MIVQRFLLAVTSGLLLEIAAAAASGLLAPGTEPYVMVGCGLGLLLAALWPGRGMGLALATGMLVVGVSAGTAQWAADHHVMLHHTGLVTDGSVSSFGSGWLVALVAGCVAVSVLCGWMLFHAREPWPVAALVGSCLLLRADVSVSYGDRFPLFTFGILLVVGLTFAGRARVWPRILPVTALSALTVVLAWTLPTAVPAWSQDFMDPLRALAPTSIHLGGSSTLSLSGPFEPKAGLAMTISIDNPSVRPYWWTKVFDKYDGRSWQQTGYRLRHLHAGASLSPGTPPGSVAMHAVVHVAHPMDKLAFPGSPLDAARDSILMSRATGADTLAVSPPETLPRGTTYETDGYIHGPQVQIATIYAGVDLNPYLQLPSIPRRVHELAVRTAGGGDTLARVLHIENFISSSGGFRYNTKIGSPIDHDAVDDFLFISRAGYCNQFATAMAILLREVGIPSRLVAGYITGRRQDHTFLVRDADAHSWVEAYLPRRGWVSFEPTRGFALDPRLTLDGSGQHHALVGPAIREPKPVVRVRVPLPGGHRRHAVVRSAPIVHHDRQRLITLLVLLLLACSCFVGVAYVRKPRTTSAVYRRMVRSRILFQRPIQPHETPLEFAVRAVNTESNRRDAVIIGELYVAERYAGRGTSPHAAQQARNAWKRLRSHQLLLWLRG